MTRTMALAILLLGGLAQAAPLTPAELQAEETRWRAQRQAALTSESGWLTLVGLFWLHPGENKLGAASDSDVVLPGQGVPARVGSLFVDERGAVKLVPSAGSGLTVNGAAASERAIATDDQPKADELRVGSLRLTVIRRGGRVAVRAKDPGAETRKAFKGLEYFAPDPRFVVEARLERFAQPKRLRVATVIGTVEEMQAPGLLKLALLGHDVAIEPVLEGDDANELFIIFKDQTAGKETYGAGRFLYARLRPDGTARIDFNQAFNPPCAFTPFATCPLPPAENRLPLRIEAGEKRYGH